MRNMTVRASLLVALTMFGVVIVIGGIAGVVSLRMANANAQRLHEIARQTILVNDAYKDSTRTRSALVRAYSALKERNDTATRDSALQSANRTLERSASETRAYRDASAFDGMDAELKRQLVASSDGLAALLARAADALRNNDTAAYVTINDRDVTRAGMVYSQNVEKLQTLANTLTEQALNDGNARYQWIVGFVVVGVGLALALVVVTHVALARIVTRPLGEAVAVLDRIASNDLTVRVPEAGRNEIGLLFAAMRRMLDGLSRTVSGVRDSCDAIHTAAREIAAGNLDLSSRTEQQSASLEETAASMEELTSTVRQNAANATEASALASGTADLARRGGDVVGRVVRTMQDISASALKIAEITNMIDSIAFQTNILALNAAVESARAGEQGRGFAVVAGEVRTLAQRSANAAREIKELIGASMNEVQNGNALAAEAGAAMEEIVGAVRNVATILVEMTSATSEQSAGIQQVGIAVSQMDQVTQQNAALVEQAAAAADALEHQAQSMKDAVAVFRLGEA
ncbi:methyl-accepting chemotaxis protein [Burkholderia vietnamiensis]|uniref:methyl-accepting chemotaxis protein n=1 Tax=Burkholderia vietnamiensis TaxID=60552 RepID=UPI00075B980C|nr:methyl-accepting chemotaxis protein [Burkholderia vietnamiensis]KVF25904.1 chemotaxis protein [Burkholderia vietnamiensis]KVF46097.1 chemotaxis protein [Burkholderia vietnamiensis]HDR9237498.1 Tar ligand binding domain-containing protein [Burkholderia vietnamiensis]